jgi:hypothetical protein
MNINRGTTRDDSNSVRSKAVSGVAKPIKPLNKKPSNDDK